MASFYFILRMQTTQLIHLSVQYPMFISSIRHIVDGAGPDPCSRIVNTLTDKMSQGCSFV